MLAGGSLLYVLFNTIVPLFQEDEQQKGEEGMPNALVCWEIRTSSPERTCGCFQYHFPLAGTSTIHGTAALLHSLVTETGAGSSPLQ